MIYDVFESDIAGSLVLAGDEQGLRHLNFINGRHPVEVESAWRHDPNHFHDLKQQLRDYFTGRRQTFDLRLQPTGTPFQMKVWQALRQIPYGQTVSYAWVARRIGQPSAVRAVGAANGRNPIVIAIPCHRVIGSNGSLTGFGGGLEIKQRLLHLENPARMAHAQAHLPLGNAQRPSSAAI